ncbi:MAG: protein translocase subunit SecD [Candidatus Yonathbacteria bacterium CG_4_10_14_3_um_filter_47_65]|uniref:Protein translocase subunit SecD n=1 Tax=Candidatus Yonathbacteria bacterium CG_4_9_14_0_8_um_filter_46_47 TaxID=1975106 RepID=A0A2M8D7F1_9BACT|nr:MAG: protein translocase subunit SecD [Candidatus Yonathbacteria bacterium CG23_combo_of_CG06-09_8_20_14_all_46_18]PIQ31578.1 MAG: protein translocase subunit SecD [Candidatus Yonathbacteria bacterium CG17_big_fil_post_rev_8_21_14_2_50_46_19]PIX56223.1 MAG: protein translocase subunit SecD [Candidatus Yonathbacteria bacterium CG_4_10_14_3_um_filter_47_65]PIY57388.1 MAG: protein translocase subunit SecD [Candidatus Yonathbacteria bacterium CG_4_10_14_0_8_um_filter_47_645]PJB83069.1 MAG: prote
MWKIRIIAFIILACGIGVGYFDYRSQVVPDSVFPFNLGLDLSGGAHLVYGADVSSISNSEIAESMGALRDVIERRVNLFGVSEPIVQVEQAGVFSSAEDKNTYRLIVELPGVTDINSAIQMIGATPTLEFKKERPKEEIEAFKVALENFQKAQEAGESIVPPQVLIDGPYDDTGLTGRFLERARLEFDQTTNEPIVSLKFNKEGSDLFASITKENVGKILAIYLDGTPISEPVVRQEITGGEAQISGSFTPAEAKTLVGRLNSGALPIDKLELLSTQTVGPSLGGKALSRGIMAGIWGIVVVAGFLIAWYRLPGFFAVIALGIYIAIVLALFKLIPVTLTAAGVAGFILSMGMAVDANILIFERMKEEMKAGNDLVRSVEDGFSRAWLSIRDGNLSSIISAVILFWFGTSLVKGFALTLGIGIMASMFSAIVITRTFLLAVAVGNNSRFVRFLFGSGFLK